MAEPWLELVQTIQEVPAPAELRQEILRRRALLHSEATGKPMPGSDPAGRRGGHLPRVAAVVAVIAGVTAVLVVLVIAAHSRSHEPPSRAANDPWAGYTHQWSQLPSPPRARTGVALAWTGSELVSLGGAIPGVGPPARDGYAFHPRTRSWSRIPPAPGPGKVGAYAVWTGSEVLVIGGSGYVRQKPVNAALDPATNTWRQIPAAPIPLPTDAVKVWTGAALIVWGGGHPGSAANRSGAVYVPATNRWHRIADAPIGLNSASGVWTGTQMIVFGSLLDHRNNSATPTAIGAAYDPRNDTWRKLPPSVLSPQATSAEWIGRRLVAWDYVGKTQDYSPSSDRWTAATDNPLGASECQPQSVVNSRIMFAWFCGRAATVGVRSGSWTPVSGGVTTPTIQLSGRPVARYQTASLTPAGSTIAIAATGVVIQHGTPCFGCKGSRAVYWVYRPVVAPPTASQNRQLITVHLGPGPTSASARIVYPKFNDTFTITTTKPPATALSGYLDADGRHLATINCPSTATATCHAGPFEGLERGTTSRTWYLHIAKHSQNPATVHVVVRFTQP